MLLGNVERAGWSGVDNTCLWCVSGGYEVSGNDSHPAPVVLRIERCPRPRCPHRQAAGAALLALALLALPSLFALLCVLPLLLLLSVQLFLLFCALGHFRARINDFGSVVLIRVYFSLFVFASCPIRQTVNCTVTYTPHTLENRTFLRR